MPTPFDATTKTLVDLGPEDWLRFFHLPFLSCQVIDSDLATVSTETDRLIEVETEADEPYIAHLEFQSGHDGAALPERLLRYNAMALVKMGKSIVSYAILLRPAADSPRLTGLLERTRPDGSVYVRFEYGLLRLWEIPVAEVLRGGLATLPLALLTDLSGTTAETVVSQLAERIESEATHERQTELWAITYVLSGARFAREESDILLGRVVAQMRESTTYQAILKEGEAEGLRKGVLAGERNVLIRMASKRLGTPSNDALKMIELASEYQILTWAERVWEVETWPELLVSR